jgi:hypothetical protein
MSKLTLAAKSKFGCCSLIRKAAPSAACALLLLLALAACQTDEADLGTDHGAGYYGSSLDDPWYYGAYNDNADIIVTPPSRPDSNPHPSHPIAAPPRPMTMPSMPRGAARAR